MGDAGQARRHRRRRSCACSTRASIPRLASADERKAREARARGRRSKPRCRRSKASTRTASCAISSTPCRRRSAPISTSSTPTASRSAHRRQVRQPQARRPAAAEAALRDLRLFAAGRGRAPALRQGRARRHPLVRPAAGLPHRGARPGQGAAGQERGDRSGRRQGRLRAQVPAQDHRRRRRRARRCRPRAPTTYKLFISTLLDITDNLGADNRIIPPDNVVRHDDDDPYLVVAADKGTATFSDIANAIADEHHFWLERCLRLRRLGRLRPQEDGHHRARRLGIGQAPLPRDGRRHRQDAVHGGRRRRHVGRRVRQRHAAREDHQARRRLRPPRHLHRSRSPTRQRASPSASACSSCRARAGRTTTNR